MGSIPLPALSVRPPEQQANPLEMYGNLVRLKGLQQQQQTQQQMAPLQVQAAQQENQQRQMQNDQMQRDAADQKKMTDAFLQAHGDPDKTIDIAGKAGVQFKTLQAARQQALEQKTKLATLTKDQLDAQKKQTDQIGADAQAILKLPPEQRSQAIQQVIPQHVQDPQQAQQVLQSIPQDPAGQEQWLKIHATAAISASEQITQVQKQQEMAQTAQNQASTQQHQRIEEKQGAQRIGIEAAAHAETKRHNQATEGQMDPAALDMAASQFASTGQMPQVGRSGAIRAQIMNAAALKYPKVDLASNQAAFKANQGALKDVQAQSDKVEAFENTAGKNLDVFLGTAKKVIDSGSPWVNKPLRSVASGALGSEDQAAFNAARQTAITEIGRVLNSANATGVVSDSARHEVEGLIGPAASLKQIYGAANILKQDMANRKQSYQDQITAIKTRIGQSSAGGNAPAQTAAPKAAGPPAGATHTAMGSDGKKHYTNSQGQDLGIAQ